MAGCFRTRSATRVMSSQSGSHWFSSFQTYGRWNKRNDQPLGLHEYQLRRPDLSFHEFLSLM